MRNLQLLFLISISSFLFSQNNPIVVEDLVIGFNEVFYDFDSANDLLRIKNDSLNKPYTGWLKNEYRSTTYYSHYKYGVKDGYSVEYKKRFSKKNLTSVKYYEKNKILEAYTLKNRQRKLKDSTIYNWNLKSCKIWNNDSTQSALQFYSFSYRNLKKYSEHYYDKESNKKQKLKFKSKQSLNLKNQLNGFLYFPSQLKEQIEFPSFIRYSDYYQAELPGIDNNSISYLIKFYPNKTAKIVNLDDETTSFNNWESKELETYTVTFNNSKNIIENYFSIEYKDNLKLEGEFTYSGISMKMNLFSSGPMYSKYFRFVKVD